MSSILPHDSHTGYVLTGRMPLTVALCVGSENNQSKGHGNIRPQQLSGQSVLPTCGTGFDALFRVRRGQEKGNRMYEQRSSEVPKSQTLS